MRLFFGIKLENDDKKTLIPMIESLKCEYEGKYTDISNLHITLAFIGEVDEKVSHMLVQIGDKAFFDARNFVIEARGISSFKGGKINYLRVLPSDDIKNIHNKLIDLLDKGDMVYTQEDEYIPHVTIRRGSKVEISRDTDTYIMMAKNICLFESKRVDDKLRYIPIKTWALKR